MMLLGQYMAVLVGTCGNGSVILTQYNLVLSGTGLVKAFMPVY